VTKDYKRLLKSKEADLVVDVTGNPLIEEALQAARRPGMSIIGGHSAKFMWQLIEERIRSKEKIEKHLLEYQSLYRLYVKEVEWSWLLQKSERALPTISMMVWCKRLQV